MTPHSRRNECQISSAVATAGSRSCSHSLISGVHYSTLTSVNHSESWALVNSHPQVNSLHMAPAVEEAASLE